MQELLKKQRVFNTQTKHITFTDKKKPRAKKREIQVTIE